MFTLTTMIWGLVVAAAALPVGLSWLPQVRYKRLRKTLPDSLEAWREPETGAKGWGGAWKTLESVLRRWNLTPWQIFFTYSLRSPTRTLPLANGFGYATVERARGPSDAPGTPFRLRRFTCLNQLTWAARTQDGHDVAIRVVVIGAQGRDHLSILRTLATGKNSLCCENHTLPMLSEFSFEDIVFGIFPKVGATGRGLFDPWAKPSSGDLVDVLMQMLEALVFIHSTRIAHRDAFYDNFLLQWQPESLRTKTVAVSRPRVYLIDFEVAVQFPPDSSAIECQSVGCPVGASFPLVSHYARPCLPEFESGRPYNAFKLDVWQLGHIGYKFKTGITEIDDVLGGMVDPTEESRWSAEEALERLTTAVGSVTPRSLLIPPILFDD